MCVCAASQVAGAFLPACSARSVPIFHWGGDPLPSFLASQLSISLFALAFFSAKLSFFIHTLLRFPLELFLPRTEADHHLGLKNTQKARSLFLQGVKKMWLPQLASSWDDSFQCVVRTSFMRPPCDLAPSCLTQFCTFCATRTQHPQPPLQEN